MDKLRNQQVKNIWRNTTAYPVAIFITIILFAQGCATKPFITEEQRAGLGQIGIVGTRNPPNVDLSSLPISKGQGAILGIGVALGESLQCGYLFPLCIVLAVPVGALSGAIGTESPDDAVMSEKSFNGNRAINEAQSLIKQKMLAYAKKYSDSKISLAPMNEAEPEDEKNKDYKKLALKGYDTILEVSVDEIKSWSPVGRNRVYFIISSSVRLISILDGGEIQNQQFRTATIWHRPADWVMDNGENLNRAFELGFDQMAAIIIDNLFLRDLIPDEPPKTGYRTIAPEIIQPISESCGPFGMETCQEFEDLALMKDLKLDFQWKNFPDEFVLHIARPLTPKLSVMPKGRISEILHNTIATINQGIENVHYDFKLYSWPDVIVYQRWGLAETKHTLDRALDSCRSYRWTIRARYVNNGKKRASGWSPAQIFRTPCGISEPVLLSSASNDSLENQHLQGMVSIQGGSFLMGAPASNNKYLRQHRVTVSPFYLDPHEVTQRQFHQVMRYNPSEFFHPERPVEQVRWDTAAQYCHKLGKRLPTEAEWEYAARAGTETKYSFGKSSKKGFGNYNYCLHCWDEDAYSNLNTKPRATLVVKYFKPNQWGLYDLYGNVAEWTTDWYGSYTTVPGTDPTGPTAGEEKVIRGGSFAGTEHDVVSYKRAKSRPIEKSKKVGFRCAADVN